MAGKGAVVFVFCCVALSSLAPAFCYEPPMDAAGPITARLQSRPSEVTDLELPLRVSVALENSAAETIHGRVRVQAIDRWRTEPSDPVEFSVAAGGQTRVAFTVWPGKDSYNAPYPIHAFAEFDHQGKRLVAHPILIMETRLANPPHADSTIPWKPVPLAADAALGLWRLPMRRIRAEVQQEESQEFLPFPMAQDQAAVPAVRFGERSGRNPAREAISVSFGLRPSFLADLAEKPTGFVWGPYTQAPRFPRSRLNLHSVSVEYPVTLPAGGPIRLRFGQALAASGDRQPVTYRVAVLPFGHALSQSRSVVFEQAAASESWRDQEVDLGRWAGQSICLQLETDSEPGSGTSAYWAEPTLVAGRAREPAAETRREPVRTMRLEHHGRSYEVRIRPGNRGILDATFEFGAGGKSLLMRGFRVRVLGDALEDWRSAHRLLETREEPAGTGYRVRHHYDGWAGQFDLLAEVNAERGALKTRFWLENVPAPQPWTHVHLEDVATGPWSEEASRIYAGHGNVIQDPEAFRISATDGHRVSTSFVGFDFRGGLSVVQGVDAPAESLKVDPAARFYSLHTAHDQILTLIPAADVWEGAGVWRDVNGLRAAGGVRKLAGRFVFDLWGSSGGGYAEGANNLARAFRYGLTDALVVWHTWQHWDYDFRLPEIYPPNPRFGSLEDFQRLVRICRDNGVLFGPHDNYIDIYPDAEGFSYDHVTMSPEGQPVRAFLSTVRHPPSQSYRLRADRALPFIERNLGLVKKGFAPTAYFVDVWAAFPPTDFWDAEGRFHDALYTRAATGKNFAWIRDFLGDQAPTISEAGHDQLIGWLDGADAQHLRVGNPIPGAYRWAALDVGCKDAERVPWFDAAHHDRFILHGAGYGVRYAGGLDQRAHGVYSDDYIATEVLTGHPAMVSEAFNRDVVRKYWLLHDLMRGLALRGMEGVEFAGGDLHRQRVRWEGGEVWVNRGNQEWQVGEHRLPQYGFYARVKTESGLIEAAVERLDGIIVEWSRSPEFSYYNARPPVLDPDRRYVSTDPDPRLGRMNTANRPVSFGQSVVTNGGFRLERRNEALWVVPLPNSPAFETRILWKVLPWSIAVPREAETLDENGRVISRVAFKIQAGAVVLDTKAGVFAYRFR
jgi:hypothetical protein